MKALNEKVIHIMKKIFVVWLAVMLLGWLIDGVLWSFWFPEEWMIMLGEGLVIWGIVFAAMKLISVLRQDGERKKV